VTRWSGAELRRLALDVLGEHADERARDALAHAAVTVAETTAHWQGSAGPVEALRVTLAVDARRLGELRGAPALTDALCSAIATAIATRPGEALLDVVLRWEPGARATASGYRSSPPGPEPTLRDALEEYLEASGEPGLAKAIDAAERKADGREVVVHVHGAFDDARSRAVLTRAVRDLLGDGTARVRVRS
jgi:hypothetical protein